MNRREGGWWGFHCNALLLLLNSLPTLPLTNVVGGTMGPPLLTFSGGGHFHPTVQEGQSGGTRGLSLPCHALAGRRSGLCACVGPSSTAPACPAYRLGSLRAPVRLAGSEYHRGGQRWGRAEPAMFLRSCPSLLIAVRELQPQTPTFDLFHFVLKRHGAPPLGWASTVGGRVVIRRVVFEQHHVCP